MGVLDKVFEILPIFGFGCKILILRLIFLVKIKRIRVNWCPRLDESALRMKSYYAQGNKRKLGSYFFVFTLISIDKSYHCFTMQ